MLTFQENIPLNEFTTIHLGGKAKHFCSCVSIDDVKEAIIFARSKNIRLQVLGGGSNTIFSDDGFNGLVIKIDLKGISIYEDHKSVIATVKGGEDWESFVRLTVESGYAGIECLSGIPGYVGATPIQNVGAYGQEVKDTIETVKVLDIDTLKELELKNSDCGFLYRNSRFKSTDFGKYIILEVIFRLEKNGRPTFHYPEVNKIIESSIDLSTLANGRESLEAVRNVILSLRKKKSMTIDSNDPNTNSVGSFFLNPIIDANVLSHVAKQWKLIGDDTEIPTYSMNDTTKIPAAWLIEKAGFSRGYKKNGVGISENHMLALVNYHGTTKALLQMAEEIQNGVEKVFGIRLKPEANVIL